MSSQLKRHTVQIQHHDLQDQTCLLQYHSGKQLDLVLIDRFVRRVSSFVFTMKTSMFACTAAVAQASIVDNLFARRQTMPSHDKYLDSVCSPNVTDTIGTLPPCISVINIQG